MSKRLREWQLPAPARRGWKSLPRLQTPWKNSPNKAAGAHWRCAQLAIPRASRRRLRRLSPVARFHCVRFANRFARNGTSGFLPLSMRARN